MNKDDEEEYRKRDRIVTVGKRRLVRGKLNQTGAVPRITLGTNANGDIMTSRACPEGMSPKRPIPMEVDVPTPPKKKRKPKQAKLAPSNQKLITEVWKQGASGVENPIENSTGTSPETLQ